MKIDRLIGIITILQQNKIVTAPYLAKRFEVSRRTIIRDIEDICRAGIPIVTIQGKGGGISIMEGFNLNTTIFTTEELQAIFTGLRSIDSVSHTSYEERLANKIAGKGSAVPQGCYTEAEDGSLIFRRGFTNIDVMISWLLGFGDKVEIIEPTEIRERFKKIAENILNKYNQT